MKLGNLLKGNSFDCELFKGDFEESPFSFGWDDEVYCLTPDGKKRFRKLLDSEVKLLSNGNIEIVNTKASETEYKLFMAFSAGYIETLLFDKWMQGVEE